MPIDKNVLHLVRFISVVFYSKEVELIIEFNLFIYMKIILLIFFYCGLGCS